MYPILGDRVDGPVGKAIDTLAIFATLFGTATSLGLGALQINGGLNYLWDVPNSTAVAILVIGVMTALFILSAVSGVHRGIQWLSNVNMVLAVVLVLFLLVVGPTVFILNTFTESIGGYASNLIPMSFRTAAFSDADWLASWTIFYWAWWISWTPFVGTFIARISKGRTIREFILGVLVVPSVVTFVWFGVLGGTAINLELSGGGNIADAVAIVMGMLSSRGILEPSKAVVVVWGALAGAAAAILLLAGGLESLQQAAIISAAPFVLVMICMCYSLFKELRAEPLPERRFAPEPERATTRPRGVPAPQQSSPLDPDSGR